MKTAKNFFIAILSFWANVCVAFERFQKLIPNGHQVLDSCDSALFWTGVGHQDPYGGGPLNAFGRDFQRYRKHWSKQLCLLDSDGDGKSNGEELGDPDCLWAIGQTPSVTNPDQLSHPGICEPIDSRLCTERNTFLSKVDSCIGKIPHWCPAMLSNDTSRIELHLSHRMQVSNNETSYICQQFQLPSDVDYQIIGWEPIIGNINILYQMVLFACDGQETTDNYVFPNDCPMKPECSSYSLIWAAGSGPKCYGEDMGVPFGRNYWRKAILQIRYENPTKNANYFDSSGFVVYYTQHKRPNNIGTIVIGQADIALPPNLPLVTERSSGSSNPCSTKKLGIASRPYNITSIHLRMNRAGFSGRILLRSAESNRKSKVLLDNFVNFNKPTTMQVIGYVTVRPGDYLQVECHYRTIERAHWTFYGETSSSIQETCLAIVEVSPLPNGRMSQTAIDYGRYDACAVGVVQLTKDCPALKDLHFFDLQQACLCSEASVTYPILTCTKACYSFLKNRRLLSEECLRDKAIFRARFTANDSLTSYVIQSQIAQCMSLEKPIELATSCNEQGDSIHFKSNAQRVSNAGSLIWLQQKTIIIFSILFSSSSSSSTTK